MEPMLHLRDPVSTPAPPPARRRPWPRGGRPPRRLLAAAGAALLALGAALWWPSTPGADVVPDATQQQVAQAFHAAVPLALPRVHSTPEAARALAALQLAPAQHRQLQADLAAGQVQLAWVQAWDSMAEDGDVIQLTSAGYTVEVPLRRAPVWLPLPVARVNAQVVVTGVRDGGGGITAALQTADGRVRLPVLAPGQTLTVPLR
jgi:hypothetical protein